MRDLSRIEGNGISFGQRVRRGLVYDHPVADEYGANKAAYNYAIEHGFELEPIDDVYLRIGQRIKQLREQRGMTQEQLCEAMPGIFKVSFLQDIEEGWVDTSIKTADNIAKFFGKELDII